MTDQAIAQSAEPAVSGPATENDLARMFMSELSGQEPQGQPNTEQGEEAQAASGENPEVELEQAQGEADDTALVKVPRLDGDGFEEIPVAEAKARMLMQQDYTRKTQAIAEERKAVQAEREKAMAVFSKQAEAMEYQLKVLGETIQSIDQQVNWEALRALDPGGYIKAREDQEQRMKQFHAGRAQMEQARKQARAERVAQNTQRLVESLPELLDQNAAKAFAENLASEAHANYGLAPQDLDAIDDHRLILALKDANEYRRLKAKSAETKAAVNKAPQLAKPGAPRQGNPQALDTFRTIARAKQSGSLDDMAAAFLKAGV